MRVSRAAVVLSVLALSVGIPAWPQQESRQDKGKRVIDDAVAALGGPAFLTLQDRTETGRMYAFDTGRMAGGQYATVYTKYLPPAAGKFSVKIRQLFGKNLDEGGYLFTPDGAWETTFRGARPVDEATWTAYQETTLRGIFYILRERLNEPGMSFYSQGGDIFEHVPVDIVDITDSSNATVTVYFDRSTHLPLRQSFRRRNKQFNDFDTEVTAFAKYRDFNGVKLPLDTHRERNGEKIFEMFVSEEQVNKALSDDLFTIPGNLKILPKGK